MPNKNNSYTIIWFQIFLMVGSLRSVVAKVQDSDIVVSEFKLQSCYSVHFRTNTPGERNEFPCPPTIKYYHYYPPARMAFVLK